MALTDSALALRVQRLVDAAGARLRTVPAEAFWREAQAASAQGVGVLALPFDRLTPFSTRAVQRLWSWEGPAVPYLVTRPGTEGARLLTRLAAGQMRKGAPCLPVGAVPFEKLLWLPVRSLSMQAVIALAATLRLGITRS